MCQACFIYLFFIFFFQFNVFFWAWYEIVFSINVNFIKSLPYNCRKLTIFLCASAKTLDARIICYVFAIRSLILANQITRVIDFDFN